MNFDEVKNKALAVLNEYIEELRKASTAQLQHIPSSWNPGMATIYAEMNRFNSYENTCLRQRISLVEAIKTALQRCQNVDQLADSILEVVYKYTRLVNYVPTKPINWEEVWNYMAKGIDVASGCAALTYPNTVLTSFETTETRDLYLVEMEALKRVVAALSN